VFLKRQKAFCVDETFSVIAILLLRPAILLRSKSYLIAVTDDAASPQLAAQVLQSWSRLYLEKQPDNFTSSISGLHSPGISWKMPKAISWESRPGSNWCSMPSAQRSPPGRNGLPA
jgi:hypothetical protein